MGRRPSGIKMCNVNYEALTNAIERAGFTRSQIAGILGKSKGFISDYKSRGNKMAEQGLQTIGIITKTDWMTFVVPEEPKQNATIVEYPITPSVDNNEIYKMLKDIYAKVDSIIELLAALSQGDKTNAVAGYDGKQPRHKQAAEILNNLIESNHGRIKKTEFVKQLMMNNIGSSYAEQTIKDCGCQVAIVGFGNNKVTWILKGDE